CTVLAFRSPRRTSASMRVRRAATSANSAATKNAFASTSATSAARRSPSDSVADPDTEAGTYPVVTRLQAPPFDALAPYLPTRGAAAEPETGRVGRAIREGVRARGDAAVAEHTRRLDGVDLAPADWEVSGARCQDALDRVPAAVRAALELAVTRVRAYHAQQIDRGFLERDPDGTAVGMRVVSLDRVGVYVPGGAQAAAARAVGTRTVPQGDRSVGAGKRFVTEARRQVAGGGIVGLDMPAGPTEVLVVADGAADLRADAADLSAQAEHDEDAS